MQLDRGTLFGTPIDIEVEMARLITKHYPSMEMMRFMSSDTEASMQAIRAARRHTGRKKFIKIEGAFIAPKTPSRCWYGSVQATTMAFLTPWHPGGGHLQHPAGALSTTSRPLRDRS